MSMVARLLVVLVAALAISVPAFAQTVRTNNDLGASVTVPDGWTEFEANDRVTFGFKHEESHSQIEIIAQPLMTADVADVFFNTFHTTLTSSGFQQLGRENRSYGAHAGSETIYSFTHSGVTLKVAVFQFVNQSTAWIVVTYIQGDVFDTYRPAYEATISSLALNG